MRVDNDLRVHNPRSKDGLGRGANQGLRKEMMHHFRSNSYIISLSGMVNIRVVFYNLAIKMT